MNKLSFEERFWSKVDKRGPDECWNWTASNTRGYGLIRFNEKVVGAHRVSFMLHDTSNELPSMHTLHRCDNPSCCNPKHLYLGTPADNGKDKKERGRARCARGVDSYMAKLTERQVQKIRIIGSALTQKKLSELFHVSKAAICNILSRRSWPHLDDRKSNSAWAA